MLNCDLDLSSFRQAATQSRLVLEEGIARAAKIAAQEGAAHAKAIGPFQNRTGRLRSGIVARFLTRTREMDEWEIVSPAPYSQFVESGTKPHDIWPKAAHGLKGPVRNGQSRRASGRGPHEHIVGRGQALRWVDSSGQHFARMVHHPGTRPMPFMGPAYFKAESVLYRESELTVQRVSALWG